MQFTTKVFLILLVYWWFCAVQSLKSLKWRQLQKWGGGSACCFMIHSRDAEAENSWLLTSRRYGTVLMQMKQLIQSENKESNTQFSREMGCSFMCCFGKAKQMESVNNEYIIFLNFTCRVNSCCFQWTEFWSKCRRKMWWFGSWRHL